jgi:O-antigen/teichoic acid export membrane protein
MSLKDRVFSAGSWILLGFVAMQVLRFGTNLILTHLLFPEAFGLMVIVYSINMGVNLLSDLGIGSGIIVHSAGSETGYLNTAWTIQVIRGGLIGLVMLACARPLAVAFSNLHVEPLLRIISLVPVINGFTSTKVPLADRLLDPKRRVSIDLGMQVFSAVVTATLAFAMHSTAALAWGSVLSALFTVVVQHKVLHGPPNRFHWDRAQAKEIVSFGQISFLSSALLFISAEGSRLFSATMVDTRMLGLIGLASGLSIMPWQAIQTLSQRVLMPAYAEVVRSGDSARLRRAVLKARLMQIIPCWILNVGMIVFAPVIFRTLYDVRYTQSAQLLQIQCVGMLVAIVTFSYNGLLVGMRRQGLSLGLQALQNIFLWAGMYFGFKWAGPVGLVVGTSLSSWVYYPFAFLTYRRLGLSNGLLDTVIISMSTVVAALLWYCTATVA